MIILKCVFKSNNVVEIQKLNDPFSHSHFKVSVVI